MSNYTSTEHQALKYVWGIPNTSFHEALAMAEHAMALVQYIETEKELDEVATAPLDDMTGTFSDGVNRDLLDRLDEDYADVLKTHKKMMEALGIPESLVTLVDSVLDETGRVIVMWYSLSADATEQQRRSLEMRNEYLMAVHRIAGWPLTIYIRPLISQ